MLIRTSASSLAVLLALSGVRLASGETRAAAPLTNKTREKISENSKKNASLPKIGIQTPGIQLPFSRVIKEAEVAGVPAWILASDTLLVPSVSGDALQRIDLKTNQRGDPLPGFSKPCAGAVAAFKSVWVANCGDSSVVRMEPKSGKVEATLATGVDSSGEQVFRSGIAATSDSVWILTDGKTTLTRVDPETNAVIAEVRLPAGCANLVFGEGSLWVTCAAEDQLLRINPVTNLVEQRIAVAATPQSVAFGDGSVWVLGGKQGQIDRLDPKTNKVVKSIALEAPNTTGRLAFGEGALWATLSGFPLVRIDTTSDKEAVLQQFHGEGGGDLHITTGAVWLSNRSQTTLWRLDPKRIIAILPE